MLLIDEVDRADDEFEAYLLEVLSDFQITVPEIGVFRAERPPLVVLTSNRTRDVHDALKRRCLYHWVEHPGFDREVAIVKLRVPAVDEGLARQVAAAVEAIRGLNLYKPPGVAETIDWANALGRLGVTQLDEQLVTTTLGTVLKYREDHQRVEQHGVAAVVKEAFEKGLLHGVSRAPPSTDDRAMPQRSDPAEIAVAFTPRAARRRAPGPDQLDAHLRRGTVCGRASTSATACTGRGGRRSSGVPRTSRSTTAHSPCSSTTHRRPVRVGRGRTDVDHDRRRRRRRHRATMAATPPTAVDDPMIELRFASTEVLRHKDFADYSADELDEAHELMARLRLVGSPRRRCASGRPPPDAASRSPTHDARGDPCAAANRSTPLPRTRPHDTAASCCCST